jgi:hypothetical protein
MNDLVKHFKFLYNVCTTPSADRRLKAFLCCLCTHVTPPIAPAPTTALGSAASVPSGFGEHSTESSSVEARRREVGNTLKSSDAILSGCRPRLRLHPPRSRTQSLPRLNSFRNSLPFILSRNPKFRFFLHRRSESRLSLPSRNIWQMRRVKTWRSPPSRSSKISSGNNSSVAEISKLWGFSENTIRQLFRKEPRGSQDRPRRDPPEAEIHEPANPGAACTTCPQAATKARLNARHLNLLATLRRSEYDLKVRNRGALFFCFEGRQSWTNRCLAFVAIAELFVTAFVQQIWKSCHFLISWQS